MSTLNGIGTTLLGISPQNAQNEASATRWFTFLFLPIAPLKRYTVRFLPHKGSGFSYQILSEEPLNWREVALTYLSGWLLMPLLLFWPFPLMVREVWQSLNLPQILSIPFMVFALLWVIIAIWKLADWHENRGRPFNPKNLSRKATEEKESSEK